MPNNGNKRPKYFIDFNVIGIGGGGLFGSQGALGVMLSVLDNEEEKVPINVISDSSLPLGRNRSSALQRHHCSNQ